MKRVIVKNKAGVQTHGAEMDAPEKWIEEQTSSGAWGKPERIVVVDPKFGEKFDEADVIERIPAEGDPEDIGYQPERVRLRAEFTVEVQDIKAEKEAEKTKREAVKTRMKGIESANSVAALRAIVKDIVEHLGLDK